MSRLKIIDLSFCETELTSDSEVYGGVTISNTINNSLGFGAIAISVSVGVSVKALNIPSLEGGEVIIGAADAAAAAASNGGKNVTAIASVSI